MAPSSPNAAAELFDDRTASLIRLKVNRLIERRFYVRGDRADLAQEFWLHLKVKRPLFDRARATLATFDDRLLTRRSLDLERRARARKRDRRCERSGARELDARSQIRGRRSLARLDLKIDVRDAVDQLPPDLRLVAEVLKRETVAGAGRALGLTRGEVRCRCDQIATVFRRLGLEPEV